MLLQLDRPVILNSGMRTRDKLRAAIRDAGFQQKEFAKMMGVTTSTLSDLLNGKRTLDVQRLGKAAKILGKTLDDFRDDDEVNEEPAETVPVPGPLGQSVPLTLDELLLVRLLRTRNLGLDEVLRALDAQNRDSGVITSHNSQRGDTSKSG